MANQSNNLFKITDFREAAFYIARGILFIRKEPPALNSDKAVFVLQDVPIDLQSEWQAHKDQVSARALYDAQDLLRDVLRGRER